MDETSWVHETKLCSDKKDDSGCRKCGEEGHMARDCSIPDKCHKCKEEGHMARDCELPDVCHKCKEEGHMARDCEKPDVCRCFFVMNVVVFTVLRISFMLIRFRIRSVETRIRTAPDPT